MDRILIIEKDPHLRMFYEIELQWNGYGTVACGRTEDCLDLAGPEAPDLMILGLQPAGRNQLEALAAVREAYGEIPVILNSSLPPNWAGPLATAADRCLNKSSDTSELLGTIASLLKERKPKWKTTRSPNPGSSRKRSRHASLGASSHGWRS